MDIYEQIKAYRPWNEQERQDQALILAFLEKNPDAFYRTNLLAHMTASAWVVNPQRTRILMVYHRLYNSWAWTGGHADGEQDLLAVALREVREETGVQSLRPVTAEIYSLEVLTVDGHEKHGRYVPSHLHLNLTYLLEAEEDQPLLVCEAENTAVAWFPLADALAASTEAWFVAHIYQKLNEKLKIL